MGGEPGPDRFDEPDERSELGPSAAKGILSKPKRPPVGEEGGLREGTGKRGAASWRNRHAVPKRQVPL